MEHIWNRGDEYSRLQYYKRKREDMQLLQATES